MTSATYEPRKGEASDRTGGGGPDCRSAPADKPRLLLVDDDENHCWALQRAFEKRGYAVKAANCAPQAESLLAEWGADYAVIDLRMPGPCGITLISQLKRVRPEVRIVVLTGYASITTAIEAIKLGAVYYLTKPVDADTLEAAFDRVCADERVEPSCNPLSVGRLEWEHIQGVLSEHQGNVSATARALRMHRRTLQRKLGKFPVRR
jgi:two-component system response regulator RegA